MDTAGIGVFKRFSGSVDIRIHRSGQRTHPAFFNGIGNRLDGLKIPLAGDGETGLNHIHLHPLQCLSDAQLFFLGHGGPGALLAITQGGIEYDEGIVGAHAALQCGHRGHRNGFGRVKNQSKKIRLNPLYNDPDWVESQPDGLLGRLTITNFATQGNPVLERRKTIASSANTRPGTDSAITCFLPLCHTLSWNQLRVRFPLP